jgi:hypothetical protein
MVVTIAREYIMFFGTFYFVGIKQIIDGKDTGLRIPLPNYSINLYPPLLDPRLDTLRIKYRLPELTPGTPVPYNKYTGLDGRVFIFEQGILGTQKDQPHCAIKYSKNCFLFKKHSVGTSFQSKFKFVTNETLLLEKVNLVENAGLFDSILSNPLFFSTLGGVAVGVSLIILQAIYNNRLYYKWPACN